MSTLAQHGPAEPGTWALARELLRLSIPATLIMVLSGMSLLVDTYFVAGLGSAAIAGVSLVFPFYLYLLMAFGGGIGVGISVVLAVRLGRGDLGSAQRVVGSAFALTVGISLAVAVAFALGGRSLFARMTGDGTVLEAAVRFARPIFFGAPVIAVCLTISNVLRSEKRVKEAAIMLLVSSAVNALLNPVLIHGRFGAPAMGVAGAGVATVLGFLVSAVLGVAYLRGGGGRRLSLGPAAWRIARRDVREILRIALPTLGSYAATICVLMVLSVIWARFGTDALASYGLVTRLEYLLAVVIYGIGSAILTLGGEAWGAGRHRELARICWIAGGCVVATTTLLAVILAVTPATWFELFGASPAVVESGARYLQIAALSYPFYALALTLNYAYQTLSRAHLPLLWSLLRGFAIAVPVAVAVAAPDGSIATAAAGVAASLVVLGALTAGWLPRSIARMRLRAVGPAAGDPRPASWSSLPALPRELEPSGELPRRDLVKASALRVSPYPLSYTLRWPWYFRRPSTRNHTEMALLPRRFERAGAGAQRRIRICAVGDIMVMQGDRVPELDPALVALFSSADLVIGTCEAAIGRPDCDPAAEHHFLFNMPAAYLRAIIEQSGAPPERWYLSAANNHSGDIGPDGLSCTVRYLRGLGVHPVGARIEGQSPFAVAEVGGVRIGIAAWTHWLNLPEPRAWRSPEILSVSWQALRETHQLDCLIGSGHWEFEWQHFPRAETRELAHRLGEAGFDLIIGSHPHVLQPLEWIGSTLCAYSLGNFCSGLGSSWAARMCNVIVVDIGTEGDARGKVVGYEVHLFAQVDDGERVRLLPLEAAPERLRARIKNRAAAVLGP